MGSACPTCFVAHDVCGFRRGELHSTHASPTVFVGSRTHALSVCTSWRASDPLLIPWSSWAARFHAASARGEKGVAGARTRRGRTACAQGPIPSRGGLCSRHACLVTILRRLSSKPGATCAAAEPKPLCGDEPLSRSPFAQRGFGPDSAMWRHGLRVGCAGSTLGAPQCRLRQARDGMNGARERAACESQRPACMRCGWVHCLCEHSSSNACSGRPTRSRTRRGTHALQLRERPPRAFFPQRGSEGSRGRAGLPAWVHGLCVGCAMGAPRRVGSVWLKGVNPCIRAAAHARTAFCWGSCVQGICFWRLQFLVGCPSWCPDLARSDPVQNKSEN